MDEKDSAINETLNHFEKVNGSEYIYVLNSKHFSDNETELLNIFAMLITKNA